MKKLKIVALTLAAFLLGATTLFVFFRGQPEMAGRWIGIRHSEKERISDPFAEPERLLDPWSSGFPGLMAMSAGEDQQVVEREDEHAVYYEISGIDQTKLSTKVEGGQLTITGETSKKSGGEEGGFFQAEMRSTFQRSFPLPPNVDEQKMEMSSEKDKVILRFPKRS